MSGKREATIVVAQFHIRVMVLDVGDMCDGVDEAHGPIKIFEPVRALQGLGIRGYSPISVKLPPQPGGLGGRQRRRAAFTRHALLGRQCARAGGFARAGSFHQADIRTYVRSM